MAYKIIPIKTSHSVAMCAAFFSLAKAMDSYENIFDDINFSDIFSDEFTFEKKRSKYKCEFIWKINKIIHWKLIFSKKLIGIECGEYAGWEKFYSLYNTFINRFIDRIICKINGIGLCFVDNFIIDMLGDNKKEFSIAKLFNKKSLYIPPAFFELKHPPAFSCFHFSDNIAGLSDIEKFNKILISANMIKGILNFDLVHEQFIQLICDNNECLNAMKSYFSNILNELHKSNKLIVSNVLEAKILSEIGL